MNSYPTSGPVVCFAKHEAGLRGLRMLVKQGADIRMLIVADSESDRTWFSAMREICNQYNIEFIPVRRLSKQPEIWEKIKAIQPAIGFTMLFTQIIPQTVIDLFEIGIVNFHPSLLPRYRGPHPVNWAIINGETEHGVTAHFVSDRVDAGPTLFQDRFPIGPDDTNMTLQTIIDSTIELQVERAWGLFRSGELKPVAQDEKNSSYYPMRSPDDGRIIWDSMGAHNIRNMVRSLQAPLYGAFFDYNGQRYIVRMSRVIDQNAGTPGLIEEVGNKMVKVQTKIGTIELQTLEYSDGSAADLTYLVKGAVLS